MATTLAIDCVLLERARRIGTLRTKKETVTRALAEFIQRPPITKESEVPRHGKDGVQYLTHSQEINWAGQSSVDLLTNLLDDNWLNNDVRQWRWIS